MRGTIVTGGAPIPCSQCRQLFVPAVVTATQRRKRDVSCPHCTRQAKQDKKRRKNNDDTNP